MAKTNRTVVRNAAYQKSEINIRERHNERKNESYYNGDIIKERFVYNIHFKSCPGTYEQEFNRMVDTGEISLRGLKQDAKVIDELIFDVNTDYFEQKGGYEYAKEFFAAAYDLAAKEAGGEQYVLSAVMHADERNKALSELYGRDIFHYHLHVVYVPIVEKKVYFRKNNKDPMLAGKLKETVNQVSHSKKWPREKDETGRWINSYSLLQDRFYEHMKDRGFTDFERGERGSTAQHLEVAEFKVKKETERVAKLEKQSAKLTEEVGKKKDTVAILDQKVEKREKKVENLDKQITVKTNDKATIDEIDNMGKPSIFGGFVLSVIEFTKLKNLAKKCVTAIQNAVKWKSERDKAVASLEEMKKRIPSTDDQLSLAKYKLAMERSPRKFRSVLEEIKRNPPENYDPERDQKQQQRYKELDR